MEIKGALSQKSSGRKGPLGPSIVGTYSCHGAEPAEGGGMTGKTNQDCACVASPMCGDDSVALLGVFDGHGVHGHIVSQEALRAMHFELDRATNLSNDPQAALGAAFEAVQAHLRLLGSQPDPAIPARESGACALVAILACDSVTVACAGDCRAVLATQQEGTTRAVLLSVDHKVDLPAEQARIEAHGAYVMPQAGSDAAGDFCPARVYESKDERWRGPGLVMSRVLGDTDAERCGVIPTPEVRHHSISKSDKFMILASDGVWEFIDSPEAVKIVDKMYAAGHTA